MDIDLRAVEVCVSESVELSSGSEERSRVSRFCSDVHF